MVNIPSNLLTELYKSKTTYESDYRDLAGWINMSDERPTNPFRRGSKKYVAREIKIADDEGSIIRAKEHHKKNERNLKNAIKGIRDYDRKQALLDTTPLPEDCIKHILGFVAKNIGGHDNEVQ